MENNTINNESVETEALEAEASSAAEAEATVEEPAEADVESADTDAVDPEGAEPDAVDPEGAEPDPVAEEKTAKPKNPNRVIKGLFGTALAILILLTILSSILLTLRLVDYIKVDDNEILLESNLDTDFDLFSATHVNEEGEVSVKSRDGESIIAPGTAVEYTIRLRNTEKVPLDVELIPNISYTAEKKIPIVIRMLTADGEYIIGNAKTWIALEDLGEESATCTLLNGESAEYVFQWKWDFESGDDAFDTELGSTAFDTNLGISASFSLRTEENTALSESLKKGAPLSGLYSGLYEIIFMIVLLVLLITAIVLMVIIIIKKMPKKSPAPVDPVEGDLPEGDLPEGDLPEGDLPEGDLPEGDLPEGELPEGELPEGELPEGALPEGDVTEEASAEDASAQEEPNETEENEANKEPEIE